MAKRHQHTTAEAGRSESQAMTAMERAMLEAVSGVASRKDAQALRHELAQAPLGDALLRKWEALEADADMLRGAERAQPPAGLTSRVMGAVPLRRPGWTGKLSDWFHRQLGAEAWLPGRVIAMAVGRCELFFYFVGLLHLCMGLAFQMKLQGYEALFPGWVQRQPEMAFALGALVLALGALVHTRTKTGRHIARIGLGAYVAAVMGNAYGLVTTFAASGMALAAVALVGGGLIMGSFLGTVLFTCSGGRKHG